MIKTTAMVMAIMIMKIMSAVSIKVIKMKMLMTKRKRIISDDLNSAKEKEGFSSYFHPIDTT